MLTINNLNVNDLSFEIINKLFSIHCELPKNDQMTKEMFEEDLKTCRREYLIAKVDKDIVGYIGVLDCVDNYDIIGIAISKSFQNKGVGTQLLNNIKNLAKESNISTISLEVDEKNIKAINFYKKNGFVLTKIRKNYYNNSDAYEMQFVIR